jgi:hypothetical protein
VIVLAAWACAVAAAVVRLERYGSTPGPRGEAARAWPAGLAWPAADEGGRFRRVVFLHPQCPCSRASVQELSRLVRRCGDALAVLVVAVHPAGASDDWEQTPLLRAAAVIPGVRIVTDPGGVTARRLGAETSGHAVLYDAAGRLLFGGGLTASRGHEGDNAGTDAIAAIVTGHDRAVPAQPVATPVFGCTLHDGPAPPTGAANATEDSK